MISLTLYQNKSYSNVVNKTLVMTGTFAQASLKESTSLINPVFLIQGMNDGLISRTNYAYVPVFNRYYYINNIIAVRTDLWEFECHVDVLMSYKSVINNSTGLIRRQENSYNLYLDDPKSKVYQNPIIVTKAFPGGFNTESFVFSVNGG